jgi:DNA-binding response OmpR family regulator
MVNPPESTSVLAYIIENRVRGVVVPTLMALGNCRLRGANSAAMAEAMLRSEPIDLLVIDSDDDVEEACALVGGLRRTIAADNPFAVTIMLTSQSDPKHIGRLRACGTDTVLVKPIDPVMFAVKVTALTRLRRTFVASPGYIGPERRTSASRPGTKPAPRIPVPNPLREMSLGTMSRAELRERIRVAWVALDEQWVDHCAA